MSHFTVLVVTAEPTEAALIAALAPFHEFECTGTDDQYVQDVDITAEARETFANQTTTALKLADGTVVPFFDREGSWKPEYSQIDPEAPEYRRDQRTYLIPEGCVKVEARYAELVGESLATWAEGWYGTKVIPFGQQPDLTEAHKYGYVLVDEAGEVVKIIDRTNPNKKWDWWSLGGRWAGMLRVVPGAAAVKGEPGLMGSKYSENGVDSCLRKDLDLTGMQRIARQRRYMGVSEAYAAIQKAHREKQEQEGVRPVDREALSNDQIAELWQRYIALRDEQFAAWQAAPAPAEGAKEKFWDWLKTACPELIRLKDLQIGEIGSGLFSGAGVPDEVKDPLEWADNAPPIGTFAFLGSDGVWRERGEMGWFATVIDGKTHTEWDAEFAEALKAIPDDHTLWVVDCHI